MIEFLLVVLIALVVAMGAAGAFVAVRSRRAAHHVYVRLAGIQKTVEQLNRERKQVRQAHPEKPEEDDEDTLGERERRIIAQITRATAPLRTGKHSVDQRARRAVAQDMHALLTLHTTFPLAAESLVYSGYAASPDTILHLTTLVRALPDNAQILEFGSGLSTVFMAAAAQREDRGITIRSIDHDPEWGAHTSAAIDRLALDAHATVDVAPLQPIDDGLEAGAQWYADSALAGITAVDLLIVDGPPRATGHTARFPAVLRLRDRLAPNAAVVLDDTDRDDEQQIVDAWIALLAPDRAPVIERVMERTTIIRLDAGARP